MHSSALYVVDVHVPCVVFFPIGVICWVYTSSMRCVVCSIHWVNPKETFCGEGAICNLASSNSNFSHVTDRDNQCIMHHASCGQLTSHMLIYNYVCSHTTSSLVYTLDTHYAMHVPQYTEARCYCSTSPHSPNMWWPCMLRACHGILVGCTPVYAVNYNTAWGYWHNQGQGLLCIHSAWIYAPCHVARTPLYAHVHICIYTVKCIYIHAHDIVCKHAMLYAYNARARGICATCILYIYSWYQCRHIINDIYIVAGTHDMG